MSELVVPRSSSITRSYRVIDRFAFAGAAITMTLGASVPFAAFAEYGGGNEAEFPGGLLFGAVTSALVTISGRIAARRAVRGSAYWEARRRTHPRLPSEESPTSGRVRRAAANLVASLTPSDAFLDEPGNEGLPSSLRSLAASRDRLLSELEDVVERSRLVGHLPTSEVAELLGLLEDHVPTSKRLYSSLPRTTRYEEAPDSASSILEDQLDGFAIELAEVNARLARLASEESRRARADLVEHGRFLAARRSALSASPDESAKTLDPTKY